MPKKTKAKKPASPRQQINVFATTENLDKIYLKTWEIYAAEIAFNLLDPNKTPQTILDLKKHFYDYQKIKKEIDTHIFNPNTNPIKLKQLFEIDFQNNLNQQDYKKMMAGVELGGLAPTLANLKNQNIAIQQHEFEKVFVLMNAILPYYPPAIRHYWNLVSLFNSCEKMQSIYFHVLNQILAVDKTDFSMLGQMQSTYLCAMMMWLSNTKSLDYSLIMSALTALEKCQHLNQMLPKVHYLDSNCDSLIFPSPLNIIDNINANFENFNKNDMPLLRLSLMDELIFFLDKVLYFGLSLIATLNQRNSIAKKYIRYEKIIEKILQNYDSQMTKEYLLKMYVKKTLDPDIDPKILKKFTKKRILKKYMEKLNNSHETPDCQEKLRRLISELSEDSILGSIRSFITLYADKNVDNDIIEIFSDEESIFLWKKLRELTDKWKKFQVLVGEDERHSAHSSRNLIETEEFQKRKDAKALEAKLAELEKLKKEQAAKEFSEKQLIKADEEEILRAKQDERLKQEPSFSILEQTQQRISHLLGIENPETKELRTIQTINDLLDTKNLDIESIKEVIISTVPQTRDIHALVLLHINLFEHFTIQIKNNLLIYQQEYGSTIAIMKDKYGIAENGDLLPFTATDHDNNNYIKSSLNKISTHIDSMLSYFKKAKEILPIIDNLKTKVSDGPSLQALNEVEIFIKDVYSYEKIPCELASLIKTLQEYKANKQSICKFLRSNPNQDSTKKIAEKNAYKQIEKLITDFQTIKEEIDNFSKIELSTGLNHSGFGKNVQKAATNLQTFSTDPSASITQSVNQLSLNPSTTNPESKFNFFQSSHQKPNPKSTVERRDELLAALYQLNLDDENTRDFKKEILSKIKGDQVIDDEEFWKLFNAIQAKIISIPTMSR